jgi:hypothetical protein
MNLLDDLYTFLQKYRRYLRRPQGQPLELLLPFAGEAQRYDHCLPSHHYAVELMGDKNFLGYRGTIGGLFLLVNGY